MIDRITVLGGSSVYIPEFILSLISHNVNVKEIVLVGKPGKKLEVVAGFCQRLLKRSGLPATVTYTTDVREGAKDAAYVVNHIRVGGMQARLRDEKLPPREGLIGDETLGAGGFANSLRTLPVIFDIAEQIAETNPDTTFINLTNPVGVCVEGLIRHCDLNVVGVSDLPGTYVKKICRIMQFNCEDIRVDYIGLNHMGWIQDIKINNTSCMGRVLEQLESQREDGFDYELIELFRMIPTRALGLYFHRERLLKNQQACSRFRAEILFEAEQQILKLYEDEYLSEIPDLTRARNAVWYEETIVPLIASFEGKTEREHIVCVRNGDSIRDLSPDSSVEIPVKVSKKGLQPRKVGSCPRFLRGLFIAVKECDRLTVKAVRHKSYEYALQALTIHPLIPSFDAARRYLDRIIKDEGFELH